MAYQLKLRAPKMRIVLLEQAAGLGVGSSGYSTGFLRAYYNLDHTMKLALDGIREPSEHAHTSMQGTTASLHGADLQSFLSMQFICVRFCIPRHSLHKHSCARKLTLDQFWGMLVRGIPQLGRLPQG